jgi:predicted RNA binding protein YcfA (HicA-like mRNA interferase family)
MHKEVAAVLKDLELDGWVWTLRKAGHVRLVHPEAHRLVTASATPSDWRWKENMLSECSRALDPAYAPKPAVAADLDVPALNGSPEQTPDDRLLCRTCGHSYGSGTALAEHKAKVHASDDEMYSPPADLTLRAAEAMWDILEASDGGMTKVEILRGAHDVMRRHGATSEHLLRVLAGVWDDSVAPSGLIICWGDEDTSGFSMVRSDIDLTFVGFIVAGSRRGTAGNYAMPLVRCGDDLFVLRRDDDKPFGAAAGALLTHGTPSADARLLMQRLSEDGHTFDRLSTGHVVVIPDEPMSQPVVFSIEDVDPDDVYERIADNMTHANKLRRAMLIISSQDEILTEMAEITGMSEPRTTSSFAGLTTKTRCPWCASEHHTDALAAAHQSNKHPETERMVRETIASHMAIEFLTSHLDRMGDRAIEVGHLDAYVARDGGPPGEGSVALERLIEYGLVTPLGEGQVLPKPVCQPDALELRGVVELDGRTLPVGRWAGRPLLGAPFSSANPIFR